MPPVPRLPFHDGRSIPQEGFGLWEVPPPDAARVVEEGLAAGYRLVDGAQGYANEAGMGEGLRASGLPRDEVFVTTKVRNERQADARRSVGESLERSGLDRFDLVLIHWPCPRQDLYVQAWRDLVALREEGAIASIGVSNFDAAQIDRLTAETGVTPVLNQVELHPRLQQAALRTAHAERGVITQSWTPLGQRKSFGDVEPIARRLGRTAAQVILRWHVELGCSVIPRSTRAEGLRENLDVWDFALTEEDHALIAALDRGERTGPDPAHLG